MNLLPIAQIALNLCPKSAISGISLFFLRDGYDLYPLIESTLADSNQSRHPGRVLATDYVKD